MSAKMRTSEAKFGIFDRGRNPRTGCVVTLIDFSTRGFHPENKVAQGPLFQTPVLVEYARANIQRLFSDVIKLTRAMNFAHCSFFAVVAFVENLKFLLSTICRALSSFYLHVERNKGFTDVSLALR